MAKNEEQEVLDPEEEEDDLEDLLDEDDEEEEPADDKDVDWKKEALKNKAIAKRLKRQLADKPEPSQTVEKQEKAVEDDEEPSLKEIVSKTATTVKMWEFAEEHGLSKAQAQAVFKLDPNPTADTLKDPFVKAGLDGVAKATRAQEATPEPSGKSFKVKNKTWNQLKPEEKKAHFGSYTQSLIEKNK